jgi:hypothetical protein
MNSNIKKKPKKIKKIIRTLFLIAFAHCLVKPLNLEIKIENNEVCFLPIFKGYDWFIVLRRFFLIILAKKRY